MQEVVGSIMDSRTNSETRDPLINNGNRIIDSMNNIRIDRIIDHMTDRVADRSFNDITDHVSKFCTAS